MQTISYRLLFIGLFWLALTGEARCWENLVDGRYISPLANYTVAAPDWPGLVVDQFNDNDFTNVAFRDQGGLMPASMWGIASLRLDSEILADLKTSGRSDVVYQRFLDYFVLPHMLQNVAPKSALFHRNYLGADDSRALFAIASIPQGHAFLRNPKRNRQDDSVCGLLIFHHGTFIYLLRLEMRTFSNPALTPQSASAKEIEETRNRLLQIRASLDHPAM